MVVTSFPGMCSAKKLGPFRGQCGRCVLLSHHSFNAPHPLGTSSQIQTVNASHTEDILRNTSLDVESQVSALCSPFTCIVYFCSRALTRFTTEVTTSPRRFETTTPPIVANDVPISMTTGEWRCLAARVVILLKDSFLVHRVLGEKLKCTMSTLLAHPCSLVPC